MHNNSRQPITSIQLSAAMCHRCSGGYHKLGNFFVKNFCTRIRLRKLISWNIFNGKQLKHWKVMEQYIALLRSLVVSFHDCFQPEHGLPEPAGSLSIHVLLLQAIILANMDIEKVLGTKGCREKWKWSEANTTGLTAASMALNAVIPFEKYPMPIVCIHSLFPDILLVFTPTLQPCYSRLLQWKITNTSC